MNDFGFLIWGISNIDGFNENILSSKEAISNDEIKKYPKDYIRQLCPIARFGGCFYVIEVASNYTFVSIINPETKETGTASDRGAYIVISFFLKNGNVFKGEVVNTLDKLMDYYLKQQSDSGQINFTDTMFEEQYSNLSSGNSYGNSFKSETSIGYKIYGSKGEIESNFNNLNIEGYKRVFFFDKSNSKLDDIINSDFIKSKYEAVNEFKKHLETGTNVKPTDKSILKDHGTIEVGGLKKRHNRLILGVVLLLIVISTVILVIKLTNDADTIGTGTPHAGKDSIKNKNDTTKSKPYTQKQGEYSTMDLLKEGVCVKDSFFQNNPYLYYKKNKWWNGSKSEKIYELNDSESKTIVNRYADPNYNFYYRCENNTIEVKKINVTWVKLNKNEQPGIFEYLSAKINIIIVDEVPLSKKLDKVTKNNAAKKNYDKSSKGTPPTIENCNDCIDISKRISKCKNDETCKKVVRDEEKKHLNEVKHGK